ncbi:hypothetical protein SDC9_78397 [bioreactor metagenome]|uniref:Uncharacterized protein n=1 Tax=bioreactor metagenome TaxID=1076179 RepID=A0A644YTE0_9ZZZZ
MFTKRVISSEIGLKARGNYFTKSAKSLAKANSVELWEREELTKEIETYFGS